MIRFVREGPPGIRSISLDGWITDLWTEKNEKRLYARTNRGKVWRVRKFGPLLFAHRVRDAMVKEAAG